ncbi:MAG: protein BatD, partial [Bacteroidales bacterium]|nr:protein BatD [Bacteroidales bacterium]
REQMIIKLKYIVFIFFATLFSVAIGQVTFTASGPKVVEAGETFQVNYVVNAAGTSPHFPSFKGFNILSGPNSSSSSNIQFINGKVSRDVTYSFSFYLSAQAKGTFSIDPASIVVKGKKVISNPLKIQVVGGSGNQAQTNQTGTQSNNNNNQQTETISSTKNQNLFVRVLTNKKTVHQGEQLVATIKVYTRLSLVGFDNMKFPSYSGFWSDEIKTPEQVTLHRESVNGKIYNVGTLKKTILTPQKSGKLIIDPFELTCVVQQRVRSNTNDFFGDFFGRYQRKKIKVISPKITINVKPLPHTNDTSFKGAVGNLKFKTTIDNTEVIENEPITLKIQISGNGNLRLFDPPKVNLPPDFETYDPKETTNIKNSESGTHGVRTIDYLFIPRHAGDFTLPPVKFTWFDLKTKKYKTVLSDHTQIIIKKGDGNNNQIITSTYSKEDVKYLGKDIHFIKQKIKKLRKKNDFKITQSQFYLWYLISLMLFIAIIIWRRKQIKENANLAKTKNKKALKIAKKRLRNAEKYLKTEDKAKFYEELAKALWLLLADKLNIPLAELTKEKAQQKLTTLKLDETFVKDYFDLIETTEYQRFAPNSQSSSLKDFYRKAINFIVQMNTKLK